MERRIGERQRWAWMAAGLSAVVASKVCGYHWLWVLVGGLVVSVYNIVLDRTLAEQGVARLLCRKFGWGGKILAGSTLLWTILVMGWVAYLADTAFPMVDGFPGLGWVLLALAVWAAAKGPAACARCCGVLCLILLALYGVVAVFAVQILGHIALHKDTVNTFVNEIFYSFFIVVKRNHFRMRPGGRHYFHQGPVILNDSHFVNLRRRTSSV